MRLPLRPAWSDWGRTLTDYDLYVGDATAFSDGSGFTEGRTAWNVGVRDQSARGAQPLEANTFLSLCNRNPEYGPVIDENRDGYVAVYIEKTDRTAGPTTGDVLELGVLHGLVDVYTPRGSHQAPFSDSRNPAWCRSAPGPTTAVSPSSPLASAHAGPTNDGRVKPDVVAAGCARIFRFRNCDAPWRPVAGSAPVSRPSW